MLSAVKVSGLTARISEAVEFEHLSRSRQVGCAVADSLVARPGT